MRCLVIIDEQILGEMDLPEGHFYGRTHPSIAWVCPLKGSIWARWYLPEQRYGWRFEIYPSPEATEWPDEMLWTWYPKVVPGSFIERNSNYIPAFFPNFLIEREFLIHAAHYERTEQWRNGELILPSVFRLLPPLPQIDPTLLSRPSRRGVPT